MSEKTQDDSVVINLLMDIKSELTKMNMLLMTINEGFQTDRSNLWKILGLTIVGAFALIGIKLAFP
jgi:hypothetical protein